MREEIDYEITFFGLRVEAVGDIDARDQAGFFIRNGLRGEDFLEMCPSKKTAFAVLKAGVTVPQVPEATITFVQFKIIEKR